MPTPRLSSTNRTKLAFARRLAPWVALLLLPVLACTPQLVSGLSADPIYLLSGLATAPPHAGLAGLPGWFDPNAGFTAQALGGLAARDWLSGIVPWWNPYSGVGLPLAAEAQPAALFLPFVLLLATPNGVLHLKLVLQVLTGCATFALLRQLQLSRRAALLGAILYQLNGTFAWTSHAPINPIPFLPLLLLGIEQAADRARARQDGGWPLISVAVAFSLYAGFPETAFIDALLALAWAALRVATLPAASRAGLIARIAGGGIVGLLLAAPIVVPFLQTLRLSYVGIHQDAAAFETAAPSAYAQVLVPYLFGPVGYGERWPFAGGYLGMVVLLLGLLALRRDRPPAALRAALAIFLALACARAARAPGISEAIDLIPFIRQTRFAVHAAPAWEMAAVVLASFALDDWYRRAGHGRAALAGAVGACGVALLAALLLGRDDLMWLLASGHHASLYVSAALLLAAGGLCGAAALLAARATPGRGAALAALLVADAVVLFALPLLSGARPVALDEAALGFLRARLGLARVYTLGPLAPNYGALFGVASINHNYLPVPRLWVDYIHAHLDPVADGILFTGTLPAAGTGEESRVAALARRVPAFAAIGVKYVLAPGGLDPFAGAAAEPARVFADEEMGIFELPDPAPYFSAAGCALSSPTRSTVVADCPSATTLVRRELLYPGWRTEVSGVPATILPAEQIFQAIALPPGRSMVRFSYAPPGIGWCLAACGTGLAALLAGLARGGGAR